MTKRLGRVPCRLVHENKERHALYPSQVVRQYVERNDVEVLQRNRKLCAILRPDDDKI